MRLSRFLVAALICGVLAGGCQRSDSLPGASGSPSDPSSYPNTDLLVTADWLNAHLDDSSVRVVDLSSIDDYRKGHIPGAVHLWWQDTIELHNDVYGMMVGNSDLQHLVASAGITPESHVILYDSSGDRYAARFLWVLNANGFANVSLLNGGRQAWNAANFALTGSEPDVAAGHLDLAINYDVLVGSDTVAQHLGDPAYVFVDNRTNEERQETWYDKLRRGRIPGAVMIPWDETTFGEPIPYYRSASSLRERFAKEGVTPDKTVIVYGLDGVTAAQTYVALKLLDYPDVRLYDGSWAEWGASTILPIEPLPSTADATASTPKATP